MNPPGDLSQVAVKAARRLQSLTPGRFYVILLVKEKDGKWRLAVLADAKIEEIKS